MHIQCKKVNKRLSFESNELLPCSFIPISRYSLQSIKSVWVNLNELKHKLHSFGMLKFQCAVSYIRVLDSLKTFVRWQIKYT